MVTSGRSRKRTRLERTFRFNVSSADWLRLVAESGFLIDPREGDLFLLGIRPAGLRQIGLLEFSCPLLPARRTFRCTCRAPVPNPFGKLDREEWHQSLHTDDFGQPFLRVWKLNGGDYLHFQYSDGPEFFIDRAGESVWSFWPEQVNFDDVLTYLAGPAFGYLLFVRGVTAASRQRRRRRGQGDCLAGTGGSGQVNHGRRLRTFEIPGAHRRHRRHREHNGEFLVQPAYLRLCLWPDSVEALYGSPEALPRLAESWEKRGLELGGDCQFEERALPLAAVYVLGERISPTPCGTISRLAPREFLITPDRQYVCQPATKRHASPGVRRAGAFGEPCARTECDSPPLAP